MASFEHLLLSFNVGDQIDDIASADPPAYLKRCFAEAVSSPALSLFRVQQICVCGMVLDSIVNGREYEELEPELIADWRVRYHADCARLRADAVLAMRRAQAVLSATDAEAAAELTELEQRIAPA